MARDLHPRPSVIGKQIRVVWPGFADDHHNSGQQRVGPGLHVDRHHRHPHRVGPDPVSQPRSRAAHSVADTTGHLGRDEINASVLAIALPYGRHAEFLLYRRALDKAGYKRTASRQVRESQRFDRVVPCRGEPPASRHCRAGVPPILPLREGCPWQCRPPHRPGSLGRDAAI